MPKGFQSMSIALKELYDQGTSNIAETGTTNGLNRGVISVKGVNDYIAAAYGISMCFLGWPT